MKAGVITFPGSNCNHDMEHALSLYSSKLVKIWHKDNNIPNDIDLIAIPGGFSYGDYLRCGAIAAHSNIMQEIKKFVDRGGYVIGVCNGFQILIEAGILPGALLRNKKLKFISKMVDLEVTSKSSKFTSSYNTNNISIPIAHHDGNYFCKDSQLKELQDNDQIAFRYKDNPNGSIYDIAGILNKKKNVLGMMPHPERAIDPKIGGIDGLGIFQSLIK